MKTRRERTFFEWWNSIPDELKNEANLNCNNENSKNMVNSINYILLKADISTMNHIMPTIEELKYWIDSGQIKNSSFTTPTFI
ncbi:MAG TPA: hypothetical protein VLA74_09430 [Nitrososphaeraceae archaeon]|nr:hypothetical protein [Nitrososphaeraceae archaeon]